MNTFHAICLEDVTINDVNFFTGQTIIVCSKYAHQLQGEGKVKIITPQNGVAYLAGCNIKTRRPVVYETKIVNNNGIFK